MRGGFVGSLVAVVAAVVVVLLLVGWKNVRVLPADVSEADLQHTMERMSRDLGVECGHCHESSEAPESDARAAKEVARGMIRMTNGLNRDYFGYPGAPMVTCATCHQGRARPVAHRPPIGALAARRAAAMPVRFPRRR